MKKLSAKKRIIKNRKSFFVTGPDAPGLKDFWVNVESNVWEPETYKIFDRFLDEKYSYIDIGAWIGPTALYGCQLAKHCFAIEPDHVAFEILKKNVNLNPSIKDRISLSEICIGPVSDSLKFGTKTQFGDSMSSILFSDSDKTINVRSLRLDDFILKNNIKDCNFIKMDIEGGESVVLPSMEQYLIKNKPMLFLSLHPFWFKEKEKDCKTVIDTLRVYPYIASVEGVKIKLSELYTTMLKIEVSNFSLFASF